jgi:predicted signal transduction protein with EAL and GGDEF domain
MTALTPVESSEPHILVCDDDPMVRLLARECLEEAGMRVTEAADGEEAISRFELDRPDLIFLDVEMPKRNGFEVCAHIRSLPEGQNVPILIATGADDRESIDQGFQSGATQYKTKPINWSLLSRDVRYMLRSAENLTALQEREAELEHLAYFDLLTGLPNRSSFLTFMDQCTSSPASRETPLGLLILNIDHFKRINDSLGHEIGDQILITIANRLQEGLAAEAPSLFSLNDTKASTLSAGKTIDLMRTGGGEFSIIVRNTDAKQLDAIAAGSLKALDDPLELSQYQLLLSPNIGIALMDPKTDSVEQMIREAGLALQASRQMGRCHFRRYDASLADDTAERLTLEKDLNDALSADDQLFMVYQPQIDAVTGQIEGVEALVRWQHPGLGMIPPDKFVNVAEGSGQIIALGSWIIQRISQDVNDNPRAFPQEWTIGINLSPLQFTQSNFVETLSALLGGLNVVELELTEGVIMSDADDSLSKMSALRDKGFRLAIDDFGTGYSSLSYLQDFPIDTLKIDRAFVSRIGSEHGDGIVKAILRLGQALKLKVIAEGVETEEQAAFLHQNACDSFQGYLYSKPVTIDALETLQDKTYPISSAATRP